ncbi:aldose epimerase, partial [Bifidobacterium breve]
MALKPRTGNQYAISSGEWSAVVTELGASLRELKWRGEDIIVPFDPDKVIPCCNGWVLAPYPNRVTNGQYSFDGEDYQMPIDEFGRQSSLHGYAHRYMWELEDLQESHVTLSWRSPDIAGYPFDITITATYALDENGLTETFTV